MKPVAVYMARWLVRSDTAIRPLLLGLSPIVVCLYGRHFIRNTDLSRRTLRKRPLEVLSSEMDPAKIRFNRLWLVDRLWGAEIFRKICPSSMLWELKLQHHLVWLMAILKWIPNGAPRSISSLLSTYRQLLATALWKNLEHVANGAWCR